MEFTNKRWDEPGTHIGPYPDDRTGKTPRARVRVTTLEQRDAARSIGILADCIHELGIGGCDQADALADALAKIHSRLHAVGMLGRVRYRDEIEENAE